MKKLEDIPKKEIFNTPEGYFDKLPAIIQARVATRHSNTTSTVFIFSLKYVLPFMILFVIGFLWFSKSNQPTDVDGIIAAVQTEDLVAYLDESDITTEEVIESADFSTTDIHEIENEIYKLDSTNGNSKNARNEIDWFLN